MVIGILVINKFKNIHFTIHRNRQKCSKCHFFNFCYNSPKNGIFICNFIVYY